MKTMPDWLYRWIDHRGKIPLFWLVRRIWPNTHYCAEWDDMLLTDGMDMELDCCSCFDTDRRS